MAIERRLIVTVEEIKSLLKSGDIAGAEQAILAELENDKNNVRLLILYGTCRQLETERIIKEMIR